ncbi:hypothetical protein Q1695_010402 [Nippostrongylus brasiliensis]|nr:hypothetical protein Q1695_010402 [Nippostrongylus brasiliensis]
MIADAQPIRFLPPIDKSDKSSIDRRISRTDSVNSRDAKNMSTSDNFEKILTEIENEIDQIQIKFKNDENKIMHSIMRLTGEAEQAGADPAARKTSMSKYGPVHPITHTPEDGMKYVPALPIK